MKDRHAVLLLLVRIGADRHATIKLRKTGESSALHITPHVLLNSRGLR